MNHHRRSDLSLIFWLCLLAVALMLVGCRALLNYNSDMHCANDKIAFTQATGCVNDGSMEFCIPADDPAALVAILEIAPNTTCISSPGRAGCDTAAQLLCIVSADGMCHPVEAQAMTDSGWQTTCDLANLSFVDKIVPTWYE